MTVEGSVTRTAEGPRATVTGTELPHEVRALGPGRLDGRRPDMAT
ncbi:hypothetical protein [Streptomyces sp. SJL17-1]|nr:hypothetical protein [Streptomyces sp. SJL17-1]